MYTTYVGSSDLTGSSAALGRGSVPCPIPHHHRARPSSFRPSACSSPAHRHRAQSRRPPPSTTKLRAHLAGPSFLSRTSGTSVLWPGRLPHRARLPGEGRGASFHGERRAVEVPRLIAAWAAAGAPSRCPVGLPFRRMKPICRARPSAPCIPSEEAGGARCSSASTSAQNRKRNKEPPPGAGPSGIWLWPAWRWAAALGERLLYRRAGVRPTGAESFNQSLALRGRVLGGIGNFSWGGRPRLWGLGHPWGPGRVPRGPPSLPLAQSSWWSSVASS